MANEFQLLEAKIEALGNTATPEQGAALVEWITEHIAQAYWQGAMEAAINIEGVYTELSMRCGEMGM